MQQIARVLITRITGALEYLPLMLPYMSLNACQLQAAGILNAQEQRQT